MVPAPFRARFDPIHALAAIDVEGDGIDELVLAGGKNLALLRGRASEAGSDDM